jgi:Flp pilus assembly protein TadG
MERFQEKCTAGYSPEPRQIQRRLIRRSRLFLRDRKGLAAVEFALLLPVMITLFFGVVETSAALSCRAQVTSIAATVADLVAQSSTTSAGDLQNVFNAGNTILYPYYDPSKGKNTKPDIVIASIVDDGSGAANGNKLTGRVAWVCYQGTAPSGLAVGSTVTFDQPLMTQNGSVIYSEARYTYQSPTSKMIAGTIQMSNKFYSKPRRVAQIPAPTGNCNF